MRGRKEGGYEDQKTDRWNGLERNVAKRGRRKLHV
jgi:hypothetical protein